MLLRDINAAEKSSFCLPLQLIYCDCSLNGVVTGIANHLAAADKAVNCDWSAGLSILFGPPPILSVMERSSTHFRESVLPNTLMNLVYFLFNEEG